jgi:predicted kinase
MEAVLFIGLPASGKSTFYKDRYFATHVRISLDLLRTRYRLTEMLNLCLATDQRFVVDNTNVARDERAIFIAAARDRRFAVVGYYFASRVEDCLHRNTMRTGKERVPDVAILSAAKRLERPRMNEGFDALWYVIAGETGFVVERWNDDL